jgi:tetratricopeptide (TPR) repeat protein
VSTAHRHFADLESRKGSFSEANSHIGEAEKTAESLKNQALIGSVLLTRAEIRAREMRSDEARGDYKKARGIAKAINNPAMAVQARLGNALEMGLTGSAGSLPELQETVRQAEQLGNVPILVGAYSALARTAFRLGKNTEADAAAGKAIDRDGSFGSVEPLFRAYLIRGLCALAVGRKDSAAEYIRHSMESFGKLVGELDRASVSSLAARPDLKPDLESLALGLKKAGLASEAEKVSSWSR